MEDRRLILFITLQFATWVHSEEVPTGHLKPLGSHKPPSVILDEFTEEKAPNPMEFYENYVKPSKAAIFRQAMIKSDAFNLWTDEYVREKYGDLEVRLESKWEKHFMTPVGEKYLGRDTLRHFIDHYHDDDSMTYVVSDLPSQMYHDMGVLPSFGSCGEMSRHIAEINLWWSGGGGRSVLHKDAYNQLNCLLNGTKHWKLVENKYEKDIYKHPEPENEVGGFSDIDPRAVDLIKHPNVMKIEWSNFTIHAGDCLFLPKSYYHQVDSYDTHNLAVSVLFGRFDDRDSLDFSDCTENTDYKTMHRLSEYEVQWMWNGTGTMVMGSSDLEDEYRRALLELAEEYAQNGKKLTQDAVEEMLLKIFEEMSFNGDIHKAFRAIDGDNDGSVTVEEVKSLKTYQLREFATEMERYEPSNNYEFEYSILTFEVVFDLLKRLLIRNEILDRDGWIKEYKNLGGTETFGNEVYDRLEEKLGVVSKKHIKKSDILYALENWVTYWAPQYSSTGLTPDDIMKKQKSKNRNGNMRDGDLQDDFGSEKFAHADVAQKQEL